MILNCRDITEGILLRLKKKKTPKKVLAAIVVGSNPASMSFLRQKQTKAHALGLFFKVYKVKSTLSEEALRKKVYTISRERQIGGVILQLPLPKKFDREIIIHAIDRKKDVDALGGSEYVLPPSVGVLKEIIKKLRITLRNKRVVIVGHGFLIGRPIAFWLNDKVKTLTVLNKDFFDTAALKGADIIISGVGKAGLIKGRHIKKGTILIDFGYSFVRGKIKGDFDAASAGQKAGHITPTPGGTGTILVAKVFENFFTLLGKQ